MFEHEYGTPEPTEAVLRAEVEALQAERITGERVRLSFYRSLPFALIFSLGQPVAAWSGIVILVGGLGAAVVLRSWQLALLATAVAGGWSLWAWAQIDDWVAEHDARIDARIRATLARGRDEGG